MSTSAPRVVGDRLEVPLVGGGHAPYVNLDFAASAPALEVVRDAVAEFLPHYSSVHRGAGFKSLVSTQAYEVARDEVARFVGARSDDVVVFTGNTTHALNLLAAALPDDTHVVVFDTEHHANLLPWRAHPVHCLHTPDAPELLVGVVEEALASLPAGPVLVSVTAASNVTGELWPVAEVAAVCARRGARIAVDCAQLAPHGPIDLAAWNVDYVALSGHKLYAPYGGGALVGRRDWLEQREPFIRGGGAVLFVSADDVAWASAPERQEAGSPNVVGAVALGVACRALREYGLDRIAAEEADLEAYARKALSAVPGLRLHRLWPEDHPRIGIATFTVGDLHHGLVAAALSAEYGIAVRDGCFCAHPLLLRLLDVDEDAAVRIRDELTRGSHAHVPGATRLSAGLPTTRADIDRAVDALSEVVTAGPRWTYRFLDSSGHYVPDPDDRPAPAMAALGG